MSAGQSCYNFADCDPRCYDTSCDKNEGCDCEGCAKVGEGKTYGWAQFNADPVAWDTDLEAKAQAWAETLAAEKVMSNLYHSDSYNTWPYSGENLAWAYANQGEAVKAWVEEEYELWKCEGNWEDVDGVGHMTAAMWKGVDLIGCANVEQYYVCQYGSVHCKDKDEPYGGAACTDTTPPHLPNFNSEGCYDTCVACKDDTEQCYNAPEEAPAEEGVEGQRRSPMNNQLT
eukprot:gene23100-27952_t